MTTDDETWLTAGVARLIVSISGVCFETRGEYWCKGQICGLQERQLHRPHNLGEPPDELETSLQDASVDVAQLRLRWVMTPLLKESEGPLFASSTSVSSANHSSESLPSST